MNSRPVPVVGPPQPARVRDDGPDKVQGKTRYVEDLRLDELGDDLLVGVIVGSPRAKGRIRSIDVRPALDVEGVVQVITATEAPRLRRVVAASMVEVGELLPLQQDRVHYHGEAVAVVLAESRAAALEGARRVVVDIEPDAPGRFSLEDAGDRLVEVSRAGIAPGRARKGDAAAVMADSPVQHDAVYACAPHHHNCMETTAVVARWDDDGGVTVRAAVQWLHIDSMIVAQAFGLDLADRLPGFVARAVLGWTPKSRVRFHNLPSGGAFGRNINPTHLLIACLAAKVAGRAVKVVLTRPQTYSLLAYRGEVSLRLRLGMGPEGRLRAVQLDPDVGKGAFGGFVEPVGEVPFMIYAHEAHALTTRVATLDRNGTGWMRGPGVSSAMFALESAMDELAHRLGVDPIALRLRNDTDVDPQSGRPWTSKGLRESFA
ncbi:MAG: molybdopterin cofactor-binding domain-containing protein, partial [Myxococcota bacterium]